MLGAMAEYVDLPHRPLLMVGTWNASTGTEGITDEDLSEIVRAHESGVLDDAIVKIGHTDPRFESRLEDGSPAYGQITNLSVDDGVLYGDYIHFPADLAESLDSAYPRSSVELARNVVLRDQDGNVVHEFGCVLTANALLGATAPAVKGLSTKMSSVASLSSGSPTYVEIPQGQFSAVRASLPGGNTAQGLAEKLSALVDDRFSSDAAWGYLEDFDDEVVYATVFADGSKPVVYRQAYTMGDNGVPELTGDPEQVVKETKWVAEGETVAASEQENDGDTPDVHPRTPETAESVSEAPTASSPDTQGAPIMAVDKEKAQELRKQYGLPKNSSTDELLAAVIADREAGNSVAPGSDETPNPEVREQQADEFENNNRKNLSAGDDEDEDEDDDTSGASDDEDKTQTTGNPGEPASAVAKHNSQGRPATVNGEKKFKSKRENAGIDSAQVSPSLLSEMTSRLSAAEARLAAREKAETDARRDGYVRQWYKDGLISDDEAQRVRARLDRDEQLTVELITERVPMFASEEIGHSQNEPSMFAAGSKDEIEAQYAADDAMFSSSK